MRPKTLIRIYFFQHFEWSRALDSAGVIHCVHVAAKSEKCTARSTDSWFLCICELAAGLRSYFQESVVETTSRLAPMHSHTPGSICYFNWSILVGFPIMLRLPAIFGHLFQFSKMYKTKYIHTFCGAEVDVAAVFRVLRTGVQCFPVGFILGEVFLWIVFASFYCPVP